MTRASTYAWYNGDIAEREAGAPSVASLSFHLGISVFDGLMAYWNREHYYIHRAEEHLVRFRAGAARMGMQIQWTVDHLLAGIQELLKLEPKGTQYIRPIAYRRAPELWITGGEGRPVDVAIFTVQVARDVDSPISCHVSAVERISSRAIPQQTKVSGAYVNSFNARRQAEQSGFQDAIMLDREGRITEASAANFFVISGARLITPPLNPDVFPGVTRQVVLEIARDIGVECTEADMRATDLVGVDGAFLCSTLMELRGISRMADLPFETPANGIYGALLARFRSITHQ